jgi:uncharacterized protein (DUF2267 family)
MKTRAVVPQASIDKFHVWIRDLQAGLDVRSAAQAVAVLRSVMRLLRDSLPIAEVADVGAQLPLILRGYWYEDWAPTRRRAHFRQRGSFVRKLEETLPRQLRVGPETAAAAVFDLLARHITLGEAKDVADVLPRDVRELWPAVRAAGRAR